MGMLMKTNADIESALQQIARFQETATKEVVVHGYLGERINLSKNLCFIPLLDKELKHTIQIVSNGKTLKPCVHELVKTIKANSPVAIKGHLVARDPKASSACSEIKNFEIQLLDVELLNEFPRDIIVTEETLFPPEKRHLQLRTSHDLREALRFRAHVAAVCRDILGRSAGFLEVETPLLFKPTPEGAREFIVPSRKRGLVYALPQSPQQYKQILMASGIPKYYQIAKCFRDEDLRADRQPEFTQLDLEMSFATGEEVMQTIENLIGSLWSLLLGDAGISPPLPRMTYERAMLRYGSDKPDIRLGMEIHNIGYLLPADLIQKLSSITRPTIEVMKIHISDDAEVTRQFVMKFMNSPESAKFQENTEGAPGVFIIDSKKPLQGLQPFGFEAAERLEDLIELTEGDLVILQARQDVPLTGGSTTMGNLRLALHKAAVMDGHLAAPKGFSFLWVTDFPLFSPTTASDPGQGGSAGISSTHHPFTSPKSAHDVDLLLSGPLMAKGDHYDLVVNGVELGGGSRRIHDAKVQEFVLRDVLKMSDDRLAEFSHLLEVLRSGCPPHAGFALGFDRLVAVMMGKESIRDVIAFPKSGKGEDLLVQSPALVTEEALQIYHLEIKQ
ncbi:MAG: hypothetical protein M1829_003628 [Trizodia sp. TS-e1964]|nr:MAG: hypothetical protein M1829_003628 [Trizodia sp. TS-e1964]